MKREGKNGMKGEDMEEIVPLLISVFYACKFYNINNNFQEVGWGALIGSSWLRVATGSGLL